MKALCMVLVIGSAACLAQAGGLEGSGMIVLDSSAQGALSMVGNAVVHIPTRAVYVNSSNASAVKTSGSATLDAPFLKVVGGTSFNGHSGCTGVVEHQPVAVDDPLSALAWPNSEGMTSFSTSSVSSGSIVLSPGYYPNGMSISGGASVVMLPGVFVFGGTGFKLTAGSLAGAGVTMVINSGSFSLAGQGAIALSAPESGATAGVVIAQRPTVTSEMKLAGGSNLSISGCIYAPKALISLVGNSQVEGDGPKMGDIVIANKVSLAGTADIKIGSPHMQAVQPSTSCTFD